MSITVENYLKKNNKKYLTNSNQCCLELFMNISKKITIKLLLCYKHGFNQYLKHNIGIFY